MSRKLGTCYMDSRNSLDDGNLIIYDYYSEIGFKDYKDYDLDKRLMFSNHELLLMLQGNRRQRI